MIDYKAIPRIFLRALLLSRLGFRRPLGVPESSSELAPSIPWCGVLLSPEIDDEAMLTFRSSGFSRNTKFKSYCVLMA